MPLLKPTGSTSIGLEGMPLTEHLVEFTDGEDTIHFWWIDGMDSASLSVNGQEIIDPERKKQEESARGVLIDIIFNAAHSKGMNPFDMVRELTF